jgi:tRNA modification GTPase
MHDLSDTIAAVSSPTSDCRVIIRVSGPDALAVCGGIVGGPVPNRFSGTLSRGIEVADGLSIDACLYVFSRPHSYTGDDLVEIHFDSNRPVTEAVMARLLSSGARMAGPGEFTARRYLCGKTDLSRAEAVAEVVAGSNRLQIDAAERLLAGELGSRSSRISREITDLLGLIEAGLDFSDGDIGPIDRRQIIAGLERTASGLGSLLSDSIRCESLMEAPSVGLAGAPNAGKSSLLNALLGRSRSIVSETPRTTRDVLSGLLETDRCRCVLFDCAGLLPRPQTQIERLAQQAAVEALSNCDLTVFCADISRRFDRWEQAVLRLIRPKALIGTATKADLVDKSTVGQRVAQLKRLSGADFAATSAATGEGLTGLVCMIGECLAGRPGADDGKTHAVVALTARHRAVVDEAVGLVTESAERFRNGQDEVAAMNLRAALRAVADIHRHGVDDMILDGIFSRFCVGK